MQFAMLEGDELALPANGMPDLAKAQGPDQIATWLRQAYPEAPPETLTAYTDHYWKLGHELLVEDVIVARTPEGNYMIGEVTGVYRREQRALGTTHIWPVSWHARSVPAERVAKLAVLHGKTGLTEITDDMALEPIRAALPYLKKSKASFFRWMGIIILIFELIYFWPKS